ncbi:hypothetical protein BI334_01665 [Moorena producens 3L]|nr:hypothetical protein BI334_01665 [Moorena producens 3L]
MARSNLKEPQADTGSLTQVVSNALGKAKEFNGLQSVTAESVVANNLTTLPDKLPTCTPSSRKQKSSRTSVQDLTTNALVLEPYWSDLCAVISSRLLLPVETDLPDLGLNSLSTWLEVTVRVVQPL